MAGRPGRRKSPRTGTGTSASYAGALGTCSAATRAPPCATRSVSCRRCSSAVKVRARVRSPAVLRVRAPIIVRRRRGGGGGGGADPWYCLACGPRACYACKKPGGALQCDNCLKWAHVGAACLRGALPPMRGERWTCADCVSKSPVGHILAVRSRHVNRVTADAKAWVAATEAAGAGAAGDAEMAGARAGAGAGAGGAADEAALCFACLTGPATGPTARCGGCARLWHAACAHAGSAVEGEWTCPLCSAGAAATVTLAMSQSHGGGGGGGGGGGASAAVPRSSVVFHDLGVADPPAPGSVVLAHAHPAFSGSRYDVRGPNGEVAGSDTLHPAFMRPAYTECLVAWRDSATVHATWVLVELLSTTNETIDVDAFFVRAGAVSASCLLACLARLCERRARARRRMTTADWRRAGGASSAVSSAWA
jgi:hypothetical protein